jgi:GTP cyclohydrolase I|nr:MAG TPA: GTP cyclohydrolase I [Caudoviricetes sp.]
MANIDSTSQTDESEIKAKEGVANLLRYLGENTEREGLLDTPKRVVKAFKEMTKGYGEDISKILKVTFESRNTNEISIESIPFSSLCEHHMLPFYGTVNVKYKPKNGRVVGLSKIPRVVEAFSKRLQIQEKLTKEIADAIQVHLDCLGVKVEIKARHMCMELRGVKCVSSETKTTYETGCYKKGI